MGLKTRRRRLAVLPAVLLALAVSACTTDGPDTPPEPADGELPTAEVQGSLGGDLVPTSVPASEVAMGSAAITTGTGLRYEDLVVGQGREAERCDLVQVDYTGSLTDGTMFDSSADSGRPLTFVLGSGQVIAGWEEGISGMRVGSQRRLAIPAELGYGSEDHGDIPANSTLVFDVDLKSAFPPPELPQQPSAVQAFVTTGSGLEYAVLQETDGAEAASGATVHVHYSGWLEDGTPFDSSIAPGRCGPLTFVLGAGTVITGWEEGVAGMKVGERRQLRIPPALAYGESGAGDVIPANATLVFEVVLAGVE